MNPAYPHGRRLAWRATVAGAIVLAAAACGRAEQSQPEAAEASPVSVTVAVAETADVAERLEAGGLVSAGTSAEVSSRVMAPVVALRVKAGDRVRAGQVLVVLDDRTLSAQARQARASTAAAEQALAAARSEEAAAAADLKLAEAWNTRITTLRRQNSATQQELDEAEARLAAANARLEGARARIQQGTAGIEAATAGAEAATTTQSFAQVTAPFDGLVTETLTEAGSLASPGVPLLRLDSVGVPEVHVRVDEARVGFIRVGDRVDVVLNGPAGEPEAPIEATVREVSRAVAADRTFTVKLALPAGQDVRAGTFARVRFRGASRPALTVPRSALRHQGQVATVFVVDEGAAHVRLVRTGAVDGDRVEILAGLDAGERIVASLPAELTDGRPVTVQDGSAR